MFLREVRIKNFRSLKNVSLLLDETTVLIGENNAGKSTLLDAIRLSLQKAVGRTLFDEFDFYMDKDIVSPADSEGIEIIIRFEERNEDEWSGFILDTFQEAVQYMDINVPIASIIIRVSAKYNDAIGEVESKTVFLNSEYEEIVGGKIQGTITRFLQLNQVFYLQALRDIKDTFGVKSPLWGKFMKKASVPDDQLTQLKEQIETINNGIIESDAHLSRLVAELNKIQNVVNLPGDDLISINAVPLRTWDLLSKAQVVLNSGMSDLELPLDKHGQGTQSVSAILLFKAYIEILLSEVNNDVTEAIMTLEEPEAHLHPQAIRSLGRVLRDIECQKIITTHSPYFIQNVDLQSIRVLRKSEGQTFVSAISDRYVIGLNSVSDGLSRIVSLHGNILELNSSELRLTIKEPLPPNIESSIRGCCDCDDLNQHLENARLIFTRQELCNLNIYVQKTRGDILFARHWVLYEGQTEEIVLPYFASVLGVDFDENGISGIMYRNNGSAGAFVKLAKVLGIKWILLGDNDQQGVGSINEIKKCGYQQTEIDNLTCLTNKIDIEHDLADDTDILADYEVALGDAITADIRQLKDQGKIEEYKEEIVKLVKKGNGKVENAYRLIEIWNERGFCADNVPELFSNFLRKVQV